MKCIIIFYSQFETILDSCTSYLVDDIFGLTAVSKLIKLLQMLTHVMKFFRLLVLSSFVVIGSLLIFNEKELLEKFIMKPENLSTLNPQATIENFHLDFLSDLKKLKTKSDQRLFKIKSIKWNFRDPELQIDRINFESTFEIDPNSLLDLEVEVFSQTDEIQKTVITQFNYTDSETKNKVHEFSRMFKMNSKNEINGKKKPD